MKRKAAVIIAAVLCAFAWSGPFAGEDGSRAEYETELDAGIDAVWVAFTTGEGLRAWMAPLVEIDLAVGGKMRSNYDPDGEIGDENTIENTILCYDPGRMLALKATKFPEGFAYADAAAGTWSIFYFEKISPARTRVTVVGLGYTDDEKSRQMRQSFAAGNKYLLDKLNGVLRGDDPDGS